MSATNTENKPGDHGKHEGAPKQQQGNEQGKQNQNPNDPKNHDPKHPQALKRSASGREAS
jgi:hypothetical protein